MTIDDALQIKLRQFEEDTRSVITRDVAQAGLFGILSAFPVGGSAIQTLLSGRAQSNVYRRVLELFEEIKQRLEQIKSSVPDEGYYGSEEFQTLLSLAFEQLQTTHDEQKRKMLADALANSGSTELLRDSSKEQYIRTLRDLSPEDLAFLKYLQPKADKGWSSWGVSRDLRPQRKNVEGEELTMASRLVGLGLAREILEIKDPKQRERLDVDLSRVDDLPETIAGGNVARKRTFQLMQKGLLAGPPDRSYEISDYGIRFLKFLSDTPPASAERR